jgi:hypothetical protein
MSEEIESKLNNAAEAMKKVHCNCKGDPAPTGQVAAWQLLYNTVTTMKGMNAATAADLLPLINSIIDAMNLIIASCNTSLQAINTLIPQESPTPTPDTATSDENRIGIYAEIKNAVDLLAKIDGTGAAIELLNTAKDDVLALVRQANGIANAILPTAPLN